jgi:hypothetical protein
MAYLLYAHFIALCVVGLVLLAARPFFSKIMDNYNDVRPISDYSKFSALQGMTMMTVAKSINYAGQRKEEKGKMLDLSGGGH